MAFNFPLFFSKFIRKRNAEYDGDPNGDYVVAEDVNELQEAVERIEQVLGLEELENTITHTLRTKLDKTEISEFGSPLFINYFGSPINAYDTIEKRINAFSYLPHVMLKKDNSSNFDYFLSEIKKSGSTLYGIVDCSSNDANIIEASIDWFNQKGFHGIYLLAFGFENGLSRSLQNSILEYIRSRSMISIITGEIETTLFNKPDPKNPTQQDLITTDGDIYLTQNIFVTNGERNTSDIISQKTFQLNRIQIEKNLLVFVEDTADITKDNRALYIHGKLLSTLYNLDGYSLAPSSRYALNEQVQKYLHGFELGKWKTDSPVYEEDAVKVARSFAKGSIVYDKIGNLCSVEGAGIPPYVYTWVDKQIPGSAIDLVSADYNADAVKTLVDGINADTESKINYSKIAGLSESGVSVEGIKDIVIRAINSSPAAVTKNPPDGFAPTAGDDYVDGRILKHIPGEEIEGDISVDSLTANVITAINAYIGDLKVGSGHIDELTANHITANVIEAINIYAKNFQAGMAVIDNAVIGQLDVTNLTANVVKAINLSAKEAIIDQAHIGALTADHISASVIKAINASIEEAKIDVAQIGTLDVNHIKAHVIEAINASVENMKIGYGRIGELKAENIQAGMIEALQLSAGHATIDDLKAAVIDVINASIDFASIDAAIIKEGTFDGALISVGSIIDAAIVSLNAGKITSGTIDTSKITLEGTDSRLKIMGNRLQVFHDEQALDENQQPLFNEDETPVMIKYERVSLGDVNGDGTEYGFRVRGKDGNTILFDQDGVRNEGITDGAITNLKIQNDAVDNRIVKQNSLSGDRLVMDAITAREIKAREINANHMQLGTLTAGSGIIARGAIGEAEIAEASIVSAHVKELSATKITSGSMQIGNRNLVSNSSFRKGFFDWEESPDLDQSEINSLILLGNTRTARIVTTNQNTPLNAGISSKMVDIIPGETLSASVYLMSQMLDLYTEPPKLQLEFFGSVDNRVTGFETQAQFTESAKWERISVTAVAPSEATQARIRIFHPQNGETYIARPMLQKGSIVTEWSGDGSFMSDDGIYTGELNANQITTGTLRADLITIGSGTTFEDGYDPTDIQNNLEHKLPYKVDIQSTNGVGFSNGNVSTILRPIIYKGTENISDTIDASRVNWYRVGISTQEDLLWNEAHKGIKEITISTSDVAGHATFLCEVLDV